MLNVSLYVGCIYSFFFGWVGVSRSVAYIFERPPLKGSDLSTIVGLLASDDA